MGLRYKVSQSFISSPQVPFLTISWRGLESETIKYREDVFDKSKLTKSLLVFIKVRHNLFRTFMTSPRLPFL